MDYDSKKKIFRDELIRVTDISRVYTDEPMSAHTTFRTGGSADFFVEAAGEDEIKEVICLCRRHDMPCYVVGNGSNLLVGDGGYRGVIIHIGRLMARIKTEPFVVSDIRETTDRSVSDIPAGTSAGLREEPKDAISERGGILRVEAGASLFSVCEAAFNAHLTGLEFAAGIPGTVGGAVTMNAGAYGGEIKDVIYDVTALDKGMNKVTLGPSKLAMGYRTSVFSGGDYVVLEAGFRLREGDISDIKAKTDDFKSRRAAKQPLNVPSAGSTFKRPSGHFAGKLIHDCGLSGLRSGGAIVSPKHNGFIVNEGNATSGDILTLMRLVISRVKDETGIILEPEIKLIGEFSGYTDGV